MLVSVGDLATDVVVQLASHDIDPVSDTPAVVTMHRGGAAANVAAVSARLGRPARFVSALGDDELAVLAATDLAAVGVDVVGPGVPRGSSLVVLVDPAGGRRFLTDPGDTDSWPALDPAWVTDAVRVHFSGYALASDGSVDACLDLAAAARRQGIACWIDPCSASAVTVFGVDRFARVIEEIVPDLLLPNEDELALVADAAGACGATVVVTRGAGATDVMSPHGAARSWPVEPVPVVDTTGAGDAFTAGFLASWDERRDAGAAVLSGHAAAARVVAGVGADAWEDAPA